MSNRSQTEPENRLKAEVRRLRLKESYSQNFLVDEDVLRRIVGVVAPQRGEHVVEIGAGAGFLTEKLLPQVGKLTAVELDPEMCQYLEKKFYAQPKFNLVAMDILKFDFTALGDSPVKVVGNLPYNITSPILFKLCGELEEADYPTRSHWSQATLMVQKEVGERITAAPGKKAYNPLSIAIQYRYHATLEMVIPAGCFAPPPKVSSAIVTLVPREAPVCEIRDLKRFSKLVNAAFAQRRKTLRNTLTATGFVSRERLEAIFAQEGVDPGLRAEEIPIEQFGALANAFAEDPGQD